MYLSFCTHFSISPTISATYTTYTSAPFILLAIQGRSVGFRSDVSALVPFDVGRMPYTDFILLPTKKTALNIVWGIVLFCLLLNGVYQNIVH